MTATHFLHRALQQRAQHTATIFKDRSRTWAEVGLRVAKLASGLRSAGVLPGERVAIVAHNSDRYVECLFATLWAGGVIVPGNTRWHPKEHRMALNEVRPRVLMVDAAFAPAIGPMAEECGADTILWVDDGEAPEGTTDVEALIEASEPMVDESGSNDDLAAIFFTGGTTGRSKGVMLSHRNILAGVLFMQATSEGYAPSVTLHAAPMFHVADAWMTFKVTGLGGAHAIVPFFSPEAVAAVIDQAQVTEVFLVPTMLKAMHEHLKQDPKVFAAVRDVVYGASPISETVLAQTKAIFPNADFRQMYGQTETSACISMLQPQFHEHSTSGKSYLRSAGRILFGVDARIADSDGNEVPTGTVGEIRVSGDGVMMGYWQQPELTSEAIVDGWVRTGDAGYFDEEGFLFLVDRVKDMIVSGGENVYSPEVENALGSHPDVIECAVFGVPDEKWGERVHAVVRMSEGSSTTAEELIAHVRSQIAAYKSPRSIDLSADPLPKSGPGKILKAEMRKAYWGGAGRSVN